MVVEDKLGTDRTSNLSGNDVPPRSTEQVKDYWMATTFLTSMFLTVLGTTFLPSSGIIKLSSIYTYETDYYIIIGRHIHGRQSICILPT